MNAHREKQKCTKSNTIRANIKSCAKSAELTTCNYKLAVIHKKTMKLHVDVHTHAEKEEDMHEDKNIDPIPPQFVFPASGRGVASIKGY